MKFCAVFAFIFVAVCCFAGQATALPAEEANFVHGVDALKTLEPEVHGRYKRATCDLLSAYKVAHSACAAHCLLRGNRGGYCNSRAVCVCRN
nr:phormicin B [Musca domestica]